MCSKKISTLWFLLYGIFAFASQFEILATANFERPLAVIITSYNNKEWYEKNLSSVFSQHYKNYRIIYIDDCSTDGTAELVEAYIHEHNQQQRTIIIKNKMRHFKMENLWQAIHMCNDNEIIIEYDGDDWLPHNDVFSRINKAYASDIWLTYSDLISWPTGKPGPNRTIANNIVEKNEFRKFNGCFWSMLRTYYAWLAQEIALKDLLLNGSFITRTSDVAIMFPMIEMAGNHFTYINEPLYIYNVQTLLNDSKVSPTLQKRIELLLRRKQPYTPLKGKISHKNDTQKADLFIFTDNNPESCALLLESIAQHVSGIKSIYIYNCSCNSYAYKKIILESPSSCIDRTWCKPADLRATLISDLNNSTHDYIIIASESDIILDKIDIHTCISALNKTKSYAFYLTIAGTTAAYEGKPPLIAIDDQTVAWQFSYGLRRFNSPISKSLTLYNKKTVEESLQYCEFTTFAEWFSTWQDTYLPKPDCTGLCFSQQRACNRELLKELIQYNAAL